MSFCKFWTPECTEGGGLDEYCMSDEYGGCPTEAQTKLYNDKGRMVDKEEDILYFRCRGGTNGSR